MDKENRDCEEKRISALPQIGFGTYPHKEALLEAIPVVISCGCTLLDTSDNYDNEEWVGKAIASAKRDELIICSKFSQPYRALEFNKCFEESLAKLGKIDMYLLHWPYPHLWKKLWVMMEELYLAGKVSAIGVCNFDVTNLKELLSFCRVKPCVNQLECHPLFQQKEITDYCIENDISVMSYSPLARMNDALMESDVIKELSGKYGVSASQIVLRWDIEHGFIPIPASAKEKHIVDNMGCLNFSLAEDEVAKIDGLEEGLRIRFDPKTRFTYREKRKFLIRRIRLAIGI